MWSGMWRIGGCTNAFLVTLSLGKKLMGHFGSYYIVDTVNSSSVLLSRFSVCCGGDLMLRGHRAGLSRRLSCNCFMASFGSKLTLFQVSSVLLQIRTSAQFLFPFYPKLVVLNLRCSFRSSVRCHPMTVTLKNTM
jgi:hypothetical protein